MCRNKIVRTADLSIEIATRIFEALNRGKITLVSSSEQITIVTDTDPKYLTFPEGWYFASGMFTNRYNTSNNSYSEAKTVNLSGETWTGAAGCLPD